MNDERIVDFEKYCKICKYEKLAEIEDPCDECLNNPSNIDSRKPISFQDK